MSALPDLLRRQAGATPTRIALAGAEGDLTYRQLIAGAEALAETLKSRAVRRIGLCGDNSPAWIVADLACLIAGVVCVPVPGFFSRQQVAHLSRQAGLDALLFSGPTTESEPLEHGVWYRRLIAPPAIPLPEGTAKITFTSGSTGTPKGVCLSANHLAATAQALQSRLAQVPMEHHLCLLPLATLLENVAGVYLPLLMGATVSVPPLAELGMTGSSGLRRGRLVRALNHYRPHSLILVPELALALVAAAEQGMLDVSGFRFLAVGGGRVAPELLHRARAQRLPLFEGYGLSECGSVVALNIPGAERVGTVGQALGHVEVRVNAEGHILVRGNTHLGYLGLPQNCGEWLDTGDLGGILEEGFIQVRGRAKNLLITSFGRNISPEWLESELTQSLGIRQALVFGDGEPQPRALLVTDGERSSAEIAKGVVMLNQCLPDYARLSTVYLRSQPLTQHDGYITSNGRLVRARILADLTQLLEAATALKPELSHDQCPDSDAVESTPLSFSGGNKMAFFDRLQSETEEARAHVTNAPVIGAIRAGQFDLAGYTWFLTQAYHHVKHTVPLMMACGARLPERLEFVRKALVEYIEEEYGHHEWILNDLAACGVDKDSVRHGQPDTSIELMVAYLYDRIERGNPVAFFGMVQVLEGTSVELATPLGKAIQEQLKLPSEAFSYLYSHGALDQDHFEFFRTLMNQISDPADQQAIIEAARMVYRLYGDMLHSIPLPVAAKEASDEAA